ncbi:MAG TPA: hypothetical protein P5250_08455 [Bacteroidales bacterium]|nr:hypothetical protein [Bacteroidales bacterium]
MNKSHLPYYLIFILIISINNSCKKEYTEGIKKYVSPKNNCYAESVFYDIIKWVNDAQLKIEDSLYNGSKNNYIINDNYISISLLPNDTLTWPKMLTINFGSGNHMCLDGKLRKGKIIAAITSRFHQQGTVITIVPNNYFVNDSYVEGTLKITCLGLSNEGHIIFKDNVKQGKIITSDGLIYWECDRTREMISGQLTPWPNIYDDTFKITGNSSGTDISAHSYTAEIINPLKLSFGCKWINEGSLEISSESFSSKMIVDYGNSECNPQATLTVDNKTYNFIINW